MESSESCSALEIACLIISSIFTKFLNNGILQTTSNKNELVHQFFIIFLPFPNAIEHFLQFIFMYYYEITSIPFPSSHFMYVLGDIPPSNFFQIKFLVYEGCEIHYYWRIFVFLQLIWRIKKFLFSFLLVVTSEYINNPQ